MAIQVTQLHILRILLQANQNLSQLQGDMRNNALTWRAVAISQSQPVETLAQWMRAAVAQYQTRLGWIFTVQADAEIWPKLSALWALLDGTAADFDNITTPLKVMADQLGTAPQTNYAQIIVLCDQVTNAIPAPPSLWPE